MKKLKEKTERQKERAKLAVEIQTGLDEILQELEDMDKVEDEGSDVSIEKLKQLKVNKSNDIIVGASDSRWIKELVQFSEPSTLYWRDIKDLDPSCFNDDFLLVNFDEDNDGFGVVADSVIVLDDGSYAGGTYENKVTHWIGLEEMTTDWFTHKILTDGKVD